MYEKGYGRDKYFSCIICGHLVWVNPVTQQHFEEVQNQCKMRIAAAEKCIKRFNPTTTLSPYAEVAATQ